MDLDIGETSWKSLMASTEARGDGPEDEVLSKRAKDFNKAWEIFGKTSEPGDNRSLLQGFIATHIQRFGQNERSAYVIYIYIYIYMYIYIYIYIIECEHQPYVALELNPEYHTNWYINNVLSRERSFQ